VYNATGKNAQAIEELNRALQLTPNSDEAQRRLAKAYFDAGRKTEAVATYQKAITANPYYWANHNVLGNAYFQLGETGKALQEYQKVTELAPENSIGYENIGAVYFRMGKWNDAIPAFQKALALEPESTTYSNLGTAYFFLKRYDDAVKMFEKAFEKNPNDEQLAGNLADAYRWSGRPQQAKETYEKAIQLAFQQLQVNPKLALATGDLALYYAKNGDQDHALQYIRQARSIDASDLQLMYYQVQIYTLAGKQAEALSVLREAFQKGYSTEEALNDPELGKLKSSPEFAHLVNEFSKKKTN
jgi:eukaryotic-like serine/threonine-protein kinase